MHPSGGVLRACLLLCGTTSSRSMLLKTLECSARRWHLQFLAIDALTPYFSAREDSWRSRFNRDNISARASQNYLCGWSEGIEGIESIVDNVNNTRSSRREFSKDAKPFLRLRNDNPGNLSCLISRKSAHFIEQRHHTDNSKFSEVFLRRILSHICCLWAYQPTNVLCTKVVVVVYLYKC